MADAPPPMPTADTEFVFEDANGLPAWVDKGGIGADESGPLVHLPKNIDQPQPYTTIVARKGDTVKFHAKTDRRGAFFEVVPKEPDDDKPATGEATPKATTTKSAAKS